MSDTDATPIRDAHEDGAGHGQGDDGAEPLGDVDVNAWVATIIGASIAILLVIALFVATQG